MTTIYSISHDANNGADFFLLLGEFLDEFYKAAPDNQTEKILHSEHQKKLPSELR